MSEFEDGPGNVFQETLEYLSKMDQVVSGKLVVRESLLDDDGDSRPRSRTSSTGSGSGEARVYHGSPIQEIREFFNKLHRVVNGKLIAGDSLFDDEEDDDGDMVVVSHSERR